LTTFGIALKSKNISSEYLFFTSQTITPGWARALGGAVGSKKRKQLEATVIAIQKRWGAKALRRGEQPLTQIPHISTSFPALDKILVGIGGIPRGRLTEILGAPTSGMTTLALKIIAQAQTKKDTAAYIDLGGTFDPDYAARCEVNLARLLLVRPGSGVEALEIAQHLIASKGVGVLVFDAVSHLLTHSNGAQTLSLALRQLPSVLSNSPCALIFLTPLPTDDAMSAANYPSGFALPHYATLRLGLKKERWLHKRGQLHGYEARVLVLKNKLGQAGQSAKVSIIFNGVVRSDGT
jgi:recombination protein RecA